jgi:hypothetical protein
MSLPETQYIYLLQVREFINKKENTYKIGKTKQKHNDRLKQYPKGSVLLFQTLCVNCDKIELHLLKLFKQKYTHRKDYGNEYFSGNYKDMIDTIYFEIKEYESNNIINDNSNDKLNITDEEDNNENESDDDNDVIKVIEIDNYEQLKNFIKCKIIITNKNTKDGYFKYDNYNLYHKLHNENSPDFSEETMESLNGYFNYFQQSLYYNRGFIINESSIDEKLVKTLIGEQYVKSPICIDIKYNKENLTSDIIDKCFIKNPLFYEFKYYEYLICCSGSYNKYYIFNGDKITLNEIIDEMGIITRINKYGSIHYINNKDIQTVSISIVDKILNKFIDKEVLNRYKKLCYSIFVKPTETPIVFYDYSNKYERGNLTRFVSDACNSLSILHIDNDEYYNGNKLEYNKMIKNKKVRLVIITKPLQCNLDKMISHFIKLGVKNIIVSQKDQTKKCLCIDELELFLKEPEIKEEILTENPNNHHFDYDIFYSNSQLSFNFILWCCSKN